MNDDDKFIHKYYASFFFKEPWKYILRIRIWLSKKISCHSKNNILDLLLKIEWFWMAGIIVVVFPNYKKLSSHMAKISENIIP